jgi:hypothetical protein
MAARNVVTPIRQSNPPTTEVDCDVRLPHRLKRVHEDYIRFCTQTQAEPTYSKELMAMVLYAAAYLANPEALRTEYESKFLGVV